MYLALEGAPDEEEEEEEEKEEKREYSPDSIGRNVSLLICRPVCFFLLNSEMQKRFNQKNSNPARHVYKTILWM